MVLGNPLLLVPARACCRDGADGCADLLGCLAFLGLGREGEVCVVACAAEDSNDNEVRGNAGESKALRRSKGGKSRLAYSLKSKIEDSGSTTCTMDSKAGIRYSSPYIGVNHRHTELIIRVRTSRVYSTQMFSL